MKLIALIVIIAGVVWLGLLGSSQLIEYEQTDVYNFESNSVQDAIDDIKPRSPTNYLKLKNTVDYVHDNVDYEVQQGSECLSETASNVLDNNKGDCTGMSKSIIAILRGMGIESRMAGGCVSQYYTCTHTYSITGQLEEREHIIHNADGSYAGGFHAWVEAKSGETWYILDGTDGSIVKSDCQDYWKSQNPDDNDRNAMCYESDQNVLDGCSGFTII